MNSSPPLEQAKTAARQARRRDIAIGTAAALLLVGFLALAIFSMSRQVGGKGLVGTITRKEFIPLKETQITIGAGGVRSRELDGTYRLHVREPQSGVDYIVDIDPSVYATLSEGDDYFFVKPPPGGDTPAQGPQEASAEASADVP